MKIYAEISAGELLDKISILEIKLKKIKEKDKRKLLNKEYNLLIYRRKMSFKLSKKLNPLYLSLKNTNLKLWNIEDNVRKYEKKKLFKKQFIDLARKVYFNNDKRSQIKLKINKILGSNIIEVKKYQNY